MSERFIAMLLAGNDSVRTSTGRAPKGIDLRKRLEGAFERVLGDVETEAQPAARAKRPTSLKGRRANVDAESKPKTTEEVPTFPADPNAVEWLKPETQRIRTRVKALAEASQLGATDPHQPRPSAVELRSRLQLGARSESTRGHSPRSAGVTVRPGVPTGTPNAMSLDPTARRRPAPVQTDGAGGLQNVRAEDAASGTSHDMGPGANRTTGHAAPAPNRATPAELRHRVNQYTARSLENAPRPTALPSRATPPPTVTAPASMAKVEPPRMERERPATSSASTPSWIGDAAAGVSVEPSQPADAVARPTPVAATEAPAPVPERIVQHIERVMAQSQRQMTVSMGELGEVRISMQQLAMQGGALQVVLEATDAQAAQLLQGQLGQLNEALQQKGYVESVVDVRHADAETAGFSEERRPDDGRSHHEEQEQREAENAARHRLNDRSRRQMRNGGQG